MRESGEDYLETIYLLSQSKDGIHAIDLANELNYARPSITKAIKALKLQGYLVIDENKHIILTQTGLERAKKIYERHQVITQFLKNLGVSDQVAAADACRMEHDLSQETFEVFKKYIQRGNNHETK